MKIIIHDLPAETAALLDTGDAQVICADGKYGHCIGCFDCWTKHPAECVIKDKLHTVCRDIGHADEMVVITENCYGMYSPAVKNVIDRSIGLSTPISDFRNREMHHGLRYGEKERLVIYVWGDMTDAEEATFRYMAERNAVNYGYRTWELHRIESLKELEGKRV